MRRSPPTPPRQESLFSPPAAPADSPARPARRRTPAHPPAAPPDERAPAAAATTAPDPPAPSAPPAPAPAPDDPAAPGPGRPQAAERAVYTVTRLNREVRALLENAYHAVWVEGEISNLSRPRSGHVYFTLKDAGAQLRCAAFRQRARLPATLRDGMKVQVRGRLSVYDARGEYQLVVEVLEEAGEGALRRAFEDLKRRLDAEGLFDVALKRPLPGLPRRIGVLTSATGAAVRDVLHVLERRFPAVPVRIYPIPVQGAAAAPAIVNMLAYASRRADCDVLILTRGGGSLEDLWAFNEEPVARAIRACAIPVVSAVGHEVDVTIADFAADHRAATPSAAAEVVVPDGAVWLRHFDTLGARLGDAAARRLGSARQRAAWLEGRLRQQHPRARLQQGAQRVDELAERLTRAMRGETGQRAIRLRHAGVRLHNCSPRRQLAMAATRLEGLRQRLAGNSARELRARQQQLAALTRALARLDPRQRLDALANREDQLRERLVGAMRRRLALDATRLADRGRTLQAVSPLATLARGYAIVQVEDGDAPSAPTGGAGTPRVVRRWHEVSPGTRIRARLGEGSITARVESTAPAQDGPPASPPPPADGGRGDDD